MHLDLPHVLMPGSLLHGTTLQCRLGHRSLSLRAPQAVLRSLYEFDGSLSPRQWLDACIKRKWDIDAATGLLTALIDHKILVCVHDVPRLLWSYVANPRSMGNAPAPALVNELVTSAQQRLAPPERPDILTLDSDSSVEPLHLLLRKRISKRHFGESVLPAKTLTAMLWASVGIVGDGDRLRTVSPSAGALYPLRHYYVNLRPTGTLPQGAYALSASEGGRLHYTPLDSDLSHIEAAFSSPELLTHAQGVLVIAADFAASAKKYGPRALSYVPLEAGHAAQNVLLAAAACDCHAVEVGGFMEDDLASLLSVDDSIVPVTTVILGSSGTSQSMEAAGEFEWVDARDAEGSRTFFLCRARLQADHPWSWGRDTSPARARLKATMESRERAALCQPRGLVSACQRDLPEALTPSTFIRYQAAQYRRPDFPYFPFDPEMAYLWKAARNILDDKPCFMLADLIYLEEGLAAYSRALPYTSANTSGAAAHDSVEVALENATLELIERDAFMRVWLGASACAINEASLPINLQTRLKRLRDAGVRVEIRDIGHAYCPVAFCYAQSEDRHFTRVSCCANYKFASAMDHALMELESQVFISLHHAAPAPIRPDQVREAADHATLYGQKAHYRKADFLISNTQYTPSARRLANNWGDLTRLLREDGQPLIAVDLSDGTPFHTPTVKAFIPGLIPLKFGAGNEPAGHPAYRHLREKNGSLTRRLGLPHPFN